MQSKGFVLLGALWLALTPALCAAGALTHPCDCPSETADCDSCCEPDEFGCGCLDGACSHDSCENDPCQVVAAPKGDVSETDLAAPPVLLWVSLLVARVEALERFKTCAPSSPPGLGKNLPYFPTDLPRRV